MMIRAWFTIVMALCAMVMAYMGVSWIYEGFGLNPWVAFPFAIALYIMPFALYQYDMEQLEKEYEESVNDAADLYGACAELHRELDSLQPDPTTPFTDPVPWAQTTVPARHTDPNAIQF